MKKLLAVVALSIFAFSVSAQNTIWPNNPGRGTMDTSLVEKTETIPLEEHLSEMKVNFVLTKIDGIPNRLIVMSGGPEQYSDVGFLCRVAEEYGGVNEVSVYNTVDGKVVRISKDCN